ncbi:MAG: DNA polymerase III subunit gamma/tau [Deltaproteobacteria bacterium]|nr:DNA polymerase III subunit gamma/tau [Deltaproteobacteria bacterium]
MARKWRPRRFEDIVGQSHITRVLRNAVSAGRIAHAYLFTGVRGVGKTTAARILAKALNCEKGPTPEPCDQCNACSEIANGSAIDVYEIDGASNRGIDEVRQIIENVKYQPAKSRFKIYIIDEVHQVTKDAFNALLKTLEEPPSFVKFSPHHGAGDRPEAERDLQAGRSADHRRGAAPARARGRGEHAGRAVPPRTGPLLRGSRSGGGEGRGNDRRVSVAGDSRGRGAKGPL